MTFEPNRTYKTRSGEDALIYCTDAPGDYPVHGRVGGRLAQWRTNGRMGRDVEFDFDLILPGPPRVSTTVWVNTYAGGPTDVYRSSEEATRHANGLIRGLRIAVPCTLTEIVP